MKYVWMALAIFFAACLLAPEAVNDVITWTVRGIQGWFAATSTGGS